MNRFTDLGKIKERAELIATLSYGLNGDIYAHCEARKDYPYYRLPAGVPKKTQIQADILRLRRELLALSKMLDE